MAKPIGLICDCSSLYAMLDTYAIENERRKMIRFNGRTYKAHGWLAIEDAAEAERLGKWLIDAAGVLREDARKRAKAKDSQ